MLVLKLRAGTVTQALVTPPTVATAWLLVGKPANGGVGTPGTPLVQATP